MVIFRALFVSIAKKNMTVVMALLDEYQQRGCLNRVIKSMTEVEVGEILQFLSKIVHDIRYSEVGT